MATESRSSAKRPLDPSIKMFMNGMPYFGQQPKSRIKRKHDGSIVIHEASSAPTDRIRIVCISDTHSCEGWQEGIPDGDILIHAGDLSLYGAPFEIDAALEHLKALPHPIKLVVAGNHDLGLDPVFIQEHEDPAMDKYSINLAEQQHMRSKWRKASKDGIIMLESETTTLTIRNRTLKVYGSPLSPYFCDWAFAYPIEADPWRIPGDVDIIITHCPPFGIMDRVPSLPGDGYVGCPQLRKHLERVQPKLHVFGHIRKLLT